MSDPIRIKGVPVEIGGRSLVVPPLSLGSLEVLQEALAGFTGDFFKPGQVTVVVDAAHAALRRNYPQMTREEVADGIGLDNAMDVMQAVMDATGMRRREVEAAAAAAAGEALPAQ